MYTMNSHLFVIRHFRLRRNFQFSSAVRNLSKASPEIASIIRVDHAGELGADRIYAGQMAVLGNTKMGPLIQHMWDQEKVHKETFERLITKYRVRPTALVPFWNVAGFVLGAGTALMGEKAAMACTVAVESVIVDHYNDQLRTLMSDPEKNQELLATIQKFRDDEQEHHDCGLDNGAEQAPFYKALTEVIKVGCKTAIAISKGLFSVRTCKNYLGHRSYCTATKERWDLISAICVERKPVILRPLCELEQKVKQMLQEMENETSYKSAHELRHEKDLAEKEGHDVKEGPLTVSQTAEDFEEECSKELNAFEFGSTITEADRNGDTMSVDRKLSSHLTLLIQRKIGDRSLWLFPQGIREEGETMRGTAERVLTEHFGNNLNVSFFGNAPCGFYKYKYPKSLGKESVGGKIFFFKVLYRSGQVEGREENSYKWCTRNELKDLLTEKKYEKQVMKFLIDENEYQELR